MNPLSLAELKAWADLTGRTLRASDVDALLELDAVLRHPEEKD